MTKLEKEILNSKTAEDLHAIIMREGRNEPFDDDTKCRAISLVAANKTAKHIQSLAVRTFDGGGVRRFAYDLENEMHSLAASRGTYKGTFGNIRIQAVEYSE